VRLDAQEFTQIGSDVACNVEVRDLDRAGSAMSKFLD
jgi:hypothetical protein